MTAKDFVKGAIKYYAQSILGLFRALFPKTYHMTFFTPKIGHKQFIRIEKIWMGQLLEEEIYELSPAVLAVAEDTVFKNRKYRMILNCKSIPSGYPSMPYSKL